MHKITIKELVNFRRKTDRTKRNFAYTLKTREAKAKIENDEKEGGGDYWVASTSSIYNVFKHDDNCFYDIKIDELRLKHELADDKRIKDMYQRNIDILASFKDFDFSDSKPSTTLRFEQVPTFYKMVTLNNFPIYVNPSLLFSYGKNELGALWLVPQLNGFKKSELGMFTEMLYRFMVKNYSDKYQISPDFCIAIDTFNAQRVSYSDLGNGTYPFLIDQTLSEIQEL